MADHVLWARLPPSTVLGALLAACGEICAQFSAGCADPWAEVADCFVPDAVFVHPGGRVEGSSGIAARAQAALGPLDASQHLLGSILVRAGAPGGDQYVIAGTYRDRLRRTSDGWRIVERVQEYSWRSGNPDVIVR